MIPAGVVRAVVAAYLSFGIVSRVTTAVSVLARINRASTARYRLGINWTAGTAGTDTFDDEPSTAGMSGGVVRARSAAAVVPGGGRIESPSRGGLREK